MSDKVKEIREMPFSMKLQSNIVLAGIYEKIAVANREPIDIVNECIILVNSPADKPRNTRLPSMPRPMLSNYKSSFNTNVAAGIDPWSMLISKLHTNISK